MNQEIVINRTNVIVNIDEDAPKLEVGTDFMNIAQQGLANGDLFTLFHLPTKKTQGRESLVDYSQSHVVTSQEYLSRMRQKTLEKEVVEIIREVQRKERLEKQARRVDNSLTIIKRVVHQELEKQQ